MIPTIPFNQCCFQTSGVSPVLLFLEARMPEQKEGILRLVVLAIIRLRELLLDDGRPINIECLFGFRQI